MRQNLNIRRVLTPQTEHYNNIGQVWLPYLMYFNSPRYSSDVVNTDSYGFRITYKGLNRVEDFSNINGIPTCLLIGGSFVFGLGATNDRNTIPTVMNANTDCLWLNFGGRALNSTQEFLLFQFFHQQIRCIKKIVILSGLNNLMLHYLSGSRQGLGPFFFQNEFDDKMNIGFMPKKSRIAKAILYPFFGHKIDYARISARDIRKYLFKKERQWGAGKKNHCAAVALGQVEDGREAILHLFSRDIANWRLFTKTMGIDLYYVLQPFSNWIDKESSKEEEMLFKHFDNLPGVIWEIITNKLSSDLYKWFLPKIKDICTLNGVNFFDMNSELSNLQLDGKWLFVDRAHCTDDGYRIVAKILEEKTAKIQ